MSARSGGSFFHSFFTILAVIDANKTGENFATTAELPKYFFSLQGCLPRELITQILSEFDSHHILNIVALRKYIQASIFSQHILYQCTRSVLVNSLLTFRVMGCLHRN